MKKILMIVPIFLFLCLAFSPLQAVNYDLGVQNFAFVVLTNTSQTVSTMTITQGDSITWHWLSGTHTVNISDGTGSSSCPFAQSINTGNQTVFNAFGSTGTYTVHCNIHSSCAGGAGTCNPPCSGGMVFTLNVLTGSTPTQTATPSETLTPSVTFTISQTATVTQTSSVTLTPNQTLTASQTATVTQTLTPSLTLSPSSTLTITLTPTPVPTGGTIDQVRVYPNVIKGLTPGVSQITIDRLPNGSTVDIYSLNWERVSSFSSADTVPGSVSWKLQNSGGSYVASGIYFCVVSFDNKSKILHLAIIR